MVKPGLKKKQNQVREMQRQLRELGPVMRGSIVYIGAKNKQYYFSLNKNKKTHLIYLGEKRMAKAREYVDNFQRLQAIIEKMTILNMELLKNDASL